MKDIKNSVTSRWQKQPPLKITFTSVLQMKSSSTRLIPALKGFLLFFRKKFRPHKMFPSSILMLISGIVYKNITDRKLKKLLIFCLVAITVVVHVLLWKELGGWRVANWPWPPWPAWGSKHQLPSFSQPTYPTSLPSLSVLEFWLPHGTTCRHQTYPQEAWYVHFASLFVS
jgi:hypothetical protein